jgi:Tfp pilus assembly protein PilO
VKGSDKAIVLGALMAVVLVGFYLKVLSPKREEAATLKTDNTELQAQIDEQNQAAAFGEQARQEFPTFYGRMVVLGKAVPDQADTASLLVQLSSIADRTDVKFDAIELGAADSGGSAPAPSSTTSAPSPTADTSSSSTGGASAGTTPSTSGGASTGSSTATSSASTMPAPATEAGAANLPIGATVGSAGLPTLSYDLTFTGSYFDVSEFLKGVDSLIRMRGSGQVAADGRLLTIDGFSVETLDGASASNPALDVKLSVTSYVTPATEGLTAGATPGGPAPSVTESDAQPASQVVAQ